ncbi:hypothetical protein CR513_31288, partial [Mucuna pruriens]
MSECNMQFQQNLTTTIQDLKMQNYHNNLCHSHSRDQSMPSMNWKSTHECSNWLESYYPFPPGQSRQGVINIPLLEAIKQVPKYANFLNELCMHKRKKLKGGVETGGIVSTLIKHEDKCRDPDIFSVPCTIGDCTFVDTMLDLGASVNVIPSSIYKSLNFGDLEPTGMIIQLANRSIVQPLGILEDILVQVNELIFPIDFYMLDIEDKASRKGSFLILGRPFLMIARTKIGVHVGTLLMEFGDNLV